MSSTITIFKKGVKEAKVSQSLVGRANENKKHGLLGMLQNIYIFMTCLFASLGCMMYGYDQGVMGSILVESSCKTSKHISPL